MKLCFTKICFKCTIASKVNVTLKCVRLSKNAVI